MKMTAATVKDARTAWETFCANKRNHVSGAQARRGRQLVPGMFREYRADSETFNPRYFVACVLETIVCEG